MLIMLALKWVAILSYEGHPLVAGHIKTLASCNNLNLNNLNLNNLNLYVNFECYVNKGFGFSASNPKSLIACATVLVETTPVLLKR